MVNVFPFFTVLEDGTPLSFVVFTFATLTVTVAFLLPDFTVILAVPASFSGDHAFAVDCSNFSIR